MEIPKIIEKNEHIYIFEKRYPNYFLYKDMKTGVKECFHLFELIKSKNDRKEAGSRWERMEN